MNVAKACPPATVQIVLGVLINTVEGTVSVPEERMQEIISLVSEWQGKVKSTKIELQSLIGKLQYVTKCVLQSRVFLNRLLETLRSMKRKKSIRLSESFQKDLKWWSMFIEKYNGVVGVRIWESSLQRAKVQIYCDNEPAVRVINSGRTKDVFMGSCIHELWLEVSKYRFQIRAVHLSGEENRVPDWLSRWECRQSFRELFYRYISEEPEKYSEIVIDPNWFKFSGIL